ncbi:hypothetical protein [Lacticaseibacillus paracasei]|uniref:hypothetical protein n=1 Tax=Lacticaseibacillus paracasei TaxID=1597 RepID=UPI0028DEC3B2|nr:hypothetical protein [Lacticaseibacillus paracasei]MDT8951542.1 hypothetical protein [Lacticaseibacillus paracasei subsp. paracasei]
MVKHKASKWTMGGITVVAASIGAITIAPNTVHAAEETGTNTSPVPATSTSTTATPTSAANRLTVSTASAEPQKPVIAAVKIQLPSENNTAVTATAETPNPTPTQPATTSKASNAVARETTTPVTPNPIVVPPTVVTPATNAVAATTSSALGQKVIDQLDAKTVGDNALQAVATATGTDAGKNGTAVLNPVSVGDQLIGQLQKLNLPTVTKNLGDVTDEQFEAEKAKADAAYLATGQSQVLTRSAGVTADATGASQTGNLYDPSGTQRASSSVMSPTTTDVYATKNESLLGNSAGDVNRLTGKNDGTNIDAIGQQVAAALNPVSWSENASDAMGKLRSAVKLALDGKVAPDDPQQGAILDTLTNQIAKNIQTGQAAQTNDSANVAAATVNAVTSDQNPLNGLIAPIKDAFSKVIAGLTGNKTDATQLANPLAATATNATQVAAANAVTAAAAPAASNDFFGNIISGIGKILGGTNGGTGGVGSGGLNWIAPALQQFISGIAPGKLLDDALHFFSIPNANTIPKIIGQIGNIAQQLGNFWGLPGLSDILQQGSGRATEGGNRFDVLTNIGKLINNSIIGTIIGSLSNKQARVMNQIQWVDPNVTDRDKNIIENGQVTDKLNPNFGKRLFTGTSDPKYIAEDTGQSADPEINRIFGQTTSFDVKTMQTADHSATAPKFGSWELDGPNTMTPDHRYLTSIRNMPMVSGLASFPSNASVSSMRIIGFQSLGQGTLTSLAASSSAPLKDGFNTRAWAPILAWDDALAYIYGPVLGGTWHSPLVDRANGNYGIWLRVQYPDGVDARSLAMSIDWWSAINVQQYTLTAALAVIPVTLTDWALEWMPRYTGWSVDDPNSIYFLVRGKKVGGADWNKIQNVDNVGGVNIQETINTILHPKGIGDIIGAIRNFSVLTPQSAPIDGKMIPNGALGMWNSLNTLINGWNQIPVIAELGTLYGLGNFSFNTHIDRYHGNYSTAEMAKILQAQGFIKNADDVAEVTAYKNANPSAFNAVDDSDGKYMTRGTLPPDPSGRMTIKWSIFDAISTTKDGNNRNATDIANAAIRTESRNLTGSNVSNSLATWHDYVDVATDKSITLNRAKEGSFTDQPDGGKTLAIYETPTIKDGQVPIFAVKNFFEKQAGNTSSAVPVDRDVTQDYLNSGLSTINISATASKASGNVGLNGKPAVVPLSELDADPGDLIAGSTNRYANIIHINGTALDGSSFLKTGDIPLTQTVNGALINNTSTNVPQLPANFAFPLRGSVVSRELKKGNTVEVQYRADELGTDGQVAVAGKWAAIPGDNAKLTVSDTSITTYQTTLSGLGLTDGKTYTVHFRTIDGYGFAREAAKSTTLTVGQAPGYQIRYVLGNGANVPGTSPKFVSATGSALTVKVSDLLSTAPAGYTLTKVLKDGAAVTTTTLTLNPQVNSVISLVFQQA